MANNKNLLFILETIDNCPGISSGEVRQELCNRNGKAYKKHAKGWQYFAELNYDGTRRSFYGPIFKKDGSPLMVDSGHYSWYFSKSRPLKAGFGPCFYTQEDWDELAKKGISPNQPLQKMGKDYGYWKPIHKNGYALTEEGKKKMKELQSKVRRG